jgi:acyl carrier protein
MNMWPGDFEAALRDSLPRLDEGAPLAPDVRLVDLGLDSMATVTLIVALEEALDLEVPDEILVPDVLATAASLWAAIEPLAGVGGSRA